MHTTPRTPRSNKPTLHFPGPPIPNFFGNPHSLLCDVQAYTAYALFKAFEGVGTDNDRVIRLLGGANKKKMGDVATYYLQTYGNSLAEDLKDELSGTFLKVCLVVGVFFFAAVLSVLFSSDVVRDNKPSGELKQVQLQRASAVGTRTVQFPRTHSR